MEFPEALGVQATTAAQRVWPGTVVDGVRPLAGGMSSLTFSARLARRDRAEPAAVVLKVAPPGLAPTLNRDVLRQARALQALHGRPGVSVPEVLFTADGDSSLGTPFFAMELVE